MTLRTAAALVSSQIGASDCETIGQGMLAQPSNTVSSMAYLVVGGWLVQRAVRDRGPDPAVRAALGVTVAAIGVGSVAFHGPMPPGARLAHDVTIIAAFMLIGTASLGRLHRWSAATTLSLFAGVTTVAGAGLAVAPDAGTAAIGLVAFLAVVIALFVAGAHTSQGLSSPAVRRLVAIASLLAIAALINMLGRTGGLLCDPQSPYQPHALWHVLTAAALGMYGHAVHSGTEKPSVRAG